jgi:nitrogen regulatory protein P-II 2
MKMVMAVIKPFKLDDVREALIKIGVEGLTVTEVRGFGRQKGRTEVPVGSATEYIPTFLSKVKIEVAIADDMEKKAINAIRNAANTGRIGDGKIFVYDLSSAMRIRTGETAEEAL